MLNAFKQFSSQLLTPDLFIKKRYKTFQELLDHDRQCHRLLAELEEIYYSGMSVDINRVRLIYKEFSSGVAAMVADLNRLSPRKYKNLIEYYKKIDFYACFALAPPKADAAPPYILPLDSTYPDDRHTGGKGLHLSQLGYILDLPVPSGFIISTSAWSRILETNDLRPIIDRALADVDIRSPASLKDVSGTITGYIERARLPADLEEALAAGVAKHMPPSKLFAIRSSAVGEDSSLSFAGLYRSFLNVDSKSIPQSYLGVLASKYTPEAIFYRIVHGLDDEETPMAALILAMVDADLSGVVTTGSGMPSSATRVYSVPGLGDGLMSGRVTPTISEIQTSGREPVIVRRGRKEAGPTEAQLFLLAEWARKISDYYGEQQELEWSSDSDGSLYLLQTRNRNLCPDNLPAKQFDVSDLCLVFQGGKSASPGLCSGKGLGPDEMETSDTGDGIILVCETTPPSLVTLLPHVAGVIARHGSAADHFASVAREFGVPVLVQAGDVVSELKTGEPLTLWADKNSIFQGKISNPMDSEKRRGRHRMENPLRRTLKMVIDFTSPLSLVDPASKAFSPENCRSLHDIIRFSHEMSVQAMFLQSTDSLLRKPKGPCLKTDIPLQAYLIDLGGGLTPGVAEREVVGPGDITCLPFLTLWRGLCHPGIDWGSRAHYDWRTYDAVALAGGASTGEDASLASYFLISSDYLNATIRFGYHFSLLDCLCTETAEENYILLRFAGGGGNTLGKDLRLGFIAKVLTRINFSCEMTGDLLDGRLMCYGRQDTDDRLNQVGRLLGVVRLMDMMLTDEQAIDPMVEDFFKGKCNFSNT